MNGAEFSKAHVDANRLGILGIVFSWFEIGAIRIRPSGTRQRTLDRFTSGRNNANVETSEGDLVARFHDGVLGVGIKLRVCFLEKCIGGLTRLNVGSVVDKF